jgi:Transglutaminase-like superfamily
MRTGLSSWMGRRTAALRSLTPAQRRTVVVTLALLPAVRMSLRLRGFKRTAMSLASRSDRTALTPDPAAARATAHAVQMVAGRSLVGARCLGRSLVLWFLLRRQGVDAVLLIGTDRPREGSIVAHAWVEVAGEPVNDRPEVGQQFASFDLQLPRLSGDIRS